MPAILSAKADCDEAEAEWSFQAKTDAWTGNGQVLLSADGVYIERHPMFSTSAAADGSADTLELGLGIVPDWRDVTLGASTVFNCGAPALTGILRVWTQDGEAQAACRVFGEAPERWAAWDLDVTCEDALTEP